MNKTVTVALASLLVLSPLAGAAYAQETTRDTERTLPDRLKSDEGPGTTQSQPMTTDTMPTGSIATDNVQIVYISSLEGDDGQRTVYTMLQSRMNDPAMLEQTQAELQSDPGLTEALTARNVQLNNVVDIQTSANGGKVVYVR